MDTAILRRSFLEELGDRLDSLVPQQYRAPDRDPVKGETVSGQATDYMKRLYTLFADIDELVKPIEAEYEQLSREMTAYTNRGLYHRFIDAIFADPETYKQKARRMHELRVELTNYRRKHGIMHEIFWLEAYRVFPDLYESVTASVNSDWSISWSDSDPASPFAEMMSAVPGGAMMAIRIG